jgi:hypothetical protein
MAERFLEAIGAGSGAERVMAAHWRQAGLLTIVRRPPRMTPLGKIQHLHVEPGASH